MKYNPKSIIALAFSFILYSSSIKAQTKNNDSIGYDKHHHYFSIKYFVGSNLLFTNHTNGLLGVSFPYTSTNAFGITTSHTFASQPKKIYQPIKSYFLPLGFEVGNKRHFYDACISFQFFPNGYTTSENISGGYGFIFYIDGYHKHNEDIANKPLLLKASMNFSYSVAGGGNLGSQFGTINNSSCRINVLGFVADSVYTHTNTNSHGGNAGSTTYSAKNLDVAFSQRELSIMPKLTLCNNPHRNGKIQTGRVNSIYQKSRFKTTWELSLGYNLPIYDRGGILLTQNDGNQNDNIHRIAKPISLSNNSLTVTYNNKTITSTPFHFSGLYVSFIMSLTRSKIE